MNKNLAVRNPLYDSLNLFDTMDQMFEDAFSRNWLSPFSQFRTIDGVNGVNSLRLDVHESDTEYDIKVSLAGVPPEAIDVKLNGDMLTISGEMSAPEINDNKKVVVQERYYGKFSRSVRLPQGVDTDGVEANYDNGVLNLVIPKLPERQAKQIEVKVKGSEVKQIEDTPVKEA